MDIQVTFDGRVWKVAPDPAKVRVGTVVRWLMMGKNCPYPRLRWTVYFHHGTPFRPWRTCFTVSSEVEMPSDTPSEPEGEHTGIAEAGPVTQQGEYKYAVMVENPEDGTTLGNDDPRLIVT